MRQSISIINKLYKYAINIARKLKIIHTKKVNLRNPFKILNQIIKANKCQLVVYRNRMISKINLKKSLGNNTFRSLVPQISINNNKELNYQKMHIDIHKTFNQLLISINNHQKKLHKLYNRIHSEDRCNLIYFAEKCFNITQIALKPKINNILELETIYCGIQYVIS